MARRTGIFDAHTEEAARRIAKSPASKNGARDDFERVDLLGARIDEIGVSADVVANHESRCAGPPISGNWYSPCIAGFRSSVAVREQVCHIAAGFDYRGIYG